MIFVRAPYLISKAPHLNFSMYPPLQICLQNNNMYLPRFIHGCQENYAYPFGWLNERAEVEWTRGCLGIIPLVLRGNVVSVHDHCLSVYVDIWKPEAKASFFFDLKKKFSL